MSSYVPRVIEFSIGTAHDHRVRRFLNSILITCTSYTIYSLFILSLSKLIYIYVIYQKVIIYSLIKMILLMIQKILSISLKFRNNYCDIRAPNKDVVILVRI